MEILENQKAALRYNNYAKNQRRTDVDFKNSLGSFYGYDNDELLAAVIEPLI